MANTRKKAAPKGGKKGYRPLAPTVQDALTEIDKGIAPDAAQGSHPPGHNQPPLFEQFKQRVDDLYLEASNWLDGDPISNEEQAAAVTKLKSLLAEAEKQADDARTDEKKPHLEAGRAVDAKWKPVIELAKKARSVAQRALTPWLEAVEAENRRKALAAQKEAEDAAARLREQAQAAVKSSDLADEDVREQLEREAEEKAKAARQMAKEAAVVRTDSGRASLRTVWLVKVTSHRDLLNYYLRERPEVAEELRKWLYERAAKDVRSGARVLPGCSIWDEKRAI